MSFAVKPVKIPEPGQAVWVDAKSTMLGDVQTNVGYYYDTRIYFEVDGKFYRTRLNETFIDGVEVVDFNEGGLFYDQPGCTGNMYTYQLSVSPGYESIIGSRDGILYIADGDTPQTFTVISEWSYNHPFPDTGFGIHCLDWETPQSSDWLYPAALFIDTNIYVRPFRLKLTPPK